jgi:hypothetical protein
LHGCLVAAEALGILQRGQDRDATRRLRSARIGAAARQHQIAGVALDQIARELESPQRAVERRCGIVAPAGVEQLRAEPTDAPTRDVSVSACVRVDG